MHNDDIKLNSRLGEALPLPQLPQQLSAAAVQQSLAGKTPRPAMRIYVRRTAAAAAVFLLVAGLAVMSPLLFGGMGGAASAEKAASPDRSAAGYDAYVTESEIWDEAWDVQQSENGALRDNASGTSPQLPVFGYAAGQTLCLAPGECAAVALPQQDGSFEVRCTDVRTGEENSAVCTVWLVAAAEQALQLMIEAKQEGEVAVQLTELLALDHETPTEYTLYVTVQSEVSHAG